MTKLQIEIGEETDYPGSKIFAALADSIGLSVDLTNFLIIQTSALLLASLFRSYLHTSKVSVSVRHAFGLLVGLFFGYFCFGPQAIHIAGLPAICYVVIRTQNPEFVQRIVMVVALTYLSCIHLHRQYNSNGAYTLDITGPLMIITQKVTSLAFSIHDGFVATENKKELSKNQQYHMIDKVPSPLEYFSYVLNFQSLMAGPLVFYRDYNDFIEGCNIKSHTNSKLDGANKKIVTEPSPVKTVLKKVLASVICAYIFIKLINVYPIKNVKEEAFINDTTIIYKFWYLMMMTMAVRFKYYFAWMFADAIVNNAGMGFNGFESDGTAKWDGLTNIYVIPFELGTNIRDCINCWNIGTNSWLRMVVYERAPKKYGTVLTFSLSALWHGFYPGYYLTFATGALTVTAARTARRFFRHHFQQTEFSRTLYDVITCLVTRLFMGYITFPFVILELGVNFRLYLRLFMCLHLIALSTIFLLPKLMRGASHARKQSVSPSTKTNVSSMTEEKNEKNDDMENKDNGITVVTRKSNSNHESEESSSSCSSFNNSMNDISDKIHVRKTESNYLLKDLINKEVNKIKDETDNLSNLLKEKIEAANIEGFIDKTVNGIVELKDDLMRMNEPEVYGPTTESLRKRNISNNDLESISTKGSTSDGNASGAFLKKEIGAIKKESTVIPAVLSNGHAK
ncbi:lysophospholipid acyltransferase 6 [Chironomus tepperi]|uniref:lysophospholipid acyltransferase 6 n=1 Tax=Chironomus tepperi TaxID=113505 RepID=UPI00391FAF68